MVSTYMPPDCGDNECLETYIGTCVRLCSRLTALWRYINIVLLLLLLLLCAYITAVFRDTEAVQLVVGGDFNCRVGSRFMTHF